MLKALSAAITLIPILQSGELDAVVAYGLEHCRTNFPHLYVEPFTQ